MEDGMVPRQTEEEVRAALRRIADEATLLVYSFDANGVCVNLNDQACKHLKSPRQFSLEAWRQFIHPADRERTIEVVNRASQTREDYQMEYRLVRSDGTVRWMRSTGAACFDEEGRHAGYTGTVTDISAWHEIQERLARSEAEHRMLAENASDLITHHDAAGRYLYVSLSCVHLLGHEPQELLGRDVYDFIHPEDAPALRAEVAEQVQTDRRPRQIELRIRCKSGDYLWLATVANVMLDARTGEKSGTVAVSRDISQQRRAREQLRESEERYRSLITLSSDAYWETDAQGRITVLQEVKGRLSEYKSQLLGKTREEVAENRSDPGLLAYLEKFARRESFRDIIYSIRMSGREDVAYFSLTGEPVYREGAFVGYRGLSRDITEQRLIQQQLQVLSDENRNLVDNSLDLICLFDEQGRLLRINPAGSRMTGYSQEELLGRRWQDLLHPQDLDRTLVRYQESLDSRSGELRNHENRWLRKDAGVVHLSWSTKWVESERVLYATARDVTEQRQAKVELERANERLTTVLESIDDAFFSFDQALRVTYCNSATLRWIDRSLHEVLGRPLLEVEPGLQGTVFEQRYREVLATRESVQFEAFFEPFNTWLWVRAYPSTDGGVSVLFHDISERKTAEAALMKSEARFTCLIESTPEGYFLAGADRRLVEVNPALCRMTGHSKEELLGQPLSVLFPSCPVQDAFHPDDRSGRLAFDLDDVVLRHRGGGEVHVLMNAMIERDAQGAPLTLTALLNDITERKRAERQLERLALHDTLTGLPNRSQLNERAEAMIAAAAQRGEALAVLFIDLDRFKEVNDSMGHEAGDLLLMEVAQRLREHMRPGDLVARLGGDEFVVVLPCSQGAKSAVAVAEKLLERLASPLELGGQEVFVGASIGISLYPHDGESRKVLFQNADAAMYHAKAAGRNGYRFFTQQMQEEARTRLTLESALRRALERGEFEVHYQPRVDVRTLEVVGSEALLRWNHPQLGRVPPAQFIPLAEETGLIDEISAWVLQQACRQNQAWVEAFGRPLSISVNLSPRQLHDRRLVSKVRQALRAADLAPHLLELELTEGAMMQDPQNAAHRLRELKALGLRLAVDDFGTGHSSLAYLRRFPLDVLKLDRSFLNEPRGNVSLGKLTQAIIHLAHTLNLIVVAEGVETAEVFSLLQEAGCDEAQGYHLCHPVPSVELEQFLLTKYPDTGRELQVGRNHPVIRLSNTSKAAC